MMSLSRIAACTLVCLASSVFTQHVQADDYKLDTAHTSIYFKVGHMNGASMVFGRFNEVAGSFSLDADAAKNSFSFSVPTESIDTNNKKRDEHLKSPDFFNAKQFPTITFKSKNVKIDGSTYTVDGDLTLHGVTKTVTVKLNKGADYEMMGGKHTGFVTELVIKRSDYGMTNMVGPAGDEVTLAISFEGSK